MSETISSNDHFRIINLKLQGPVFSEARLSMLALENRMSWLESARDQLTAERDAAQARIADLLTDAPRAYLRVFGSRNEGWRVAVVDVVDNAGHFVSAAYDSRDAALVSAFHWAMSNGLMVVTGERADTP